MSETIQQFAESLLRKYDGVMDADALQMAREDYQAGEYEVAAISVIEVAPVTDAEIDELLDLAQHFESTDADTAQTVAAKSRNKLRRTA